MENDTRDAPLDPLRRAQGIDDNGERQVEMTISARASYAIDRLARRHRIARRDVIERLVLAADEDIYAQMDIDSEDWASYFGVGGLKLE